MHEKIQNAMVEFLGYRFSICESKNSGHIKSVIFRGNPCNVCVRACVCKMPFCPLVAGSVGRNLANKPNVYVSSSAGARWKEVSTESDTDDKKNTACKTESQAARLSKAFQHFTIHFISVAVPRHYEPFCTFCYGRPFLENTSRNS